MKYINNIYQALNEIDFNIDDYKKEELSDIEKKKLKINLKRSRRKRFSFKKIGTIAATLVLIFGILSQTTFIRNVYSYTEYKLSQWYLSLGELLNLGNDFEPYSNVVNQVIKNNGVEIKLIDVIIDEDQLLISSIVDGGDFKRNRGVRYETDIYINKEKVSSRTSRTYQYLIDGENSIYSLRHEFRINDIDVNNRLDIRIEYFDLYFGEQENGETVEGRWEFEFTASGKDLMADTIKVPLDYSIDIEDGRVVLEELSFNVINQKISGELEYDDIKELERNQINAIRLLGEDNLGNKLVFDLERFSWTNLEFKAKKYNMNQLSDVQSITLAPYIAEDWEPFTNNWVQIGEKFTIYLD